MNLYHPLRSLGDPQPKPTRPEVERSIRLQIQKLQTAMRNGSNVRDDETAERAVQVLTTHVYINAVPWSFGLGTVVRGRYEDTDKFVTNVASSRGEVIYELNYTTPYYKRDDLVFVAHASQKTLADMAELHLNVVF